ncbi:hypothetical protein EV182_002092 [Spiromyces aspiralis]|uniref:Uncharacterized protein n=1 Tax=Spiromyces aspiralis TaxID=68401 RepID=A0ACC1HVR6_9FUNG|nr:hypothetical protein EV182_002092 [Spiromyces aspiralis]
MVFDAAVSPRTRRLIDPARIGVHFFREPLIIGDDNEFESYSCKYPRKLRQRSPLNVNAFAPLLTCGAGMMRRAVGDTTIGSNCVIGPGCSTDPSGETPIADGTVIYGADEMIRVRNKVDTAGYLQLHQKHLKYLVETLPKYNHILET